MSGHRNDHDSCCQPGRCSDRTGRERQHQHHQQRPRHCDRHPACLRQHGQCRWNGHGKTLCWGTSISSFLFFLFLSKCRLTRWGVEDHRSHSLLFLCLFDQHYQLIFNLSTFVISHKLYVDWECFLSKTLPGCFSCSKFRIFIIVKISVLLKLNRC